MQTTMDRELNIMDEQCIKHGIAFDMDSDNTEIVKDYIQQKLIPFQLFYPGDNDWIDYNTVKWFNSFRDMRRVCFKSDIELNINSWAIPIMIENMNKGRVGDDAQLILLQGQIDTLRKDLAWEKKQRLK